MWSRNKLTIQKEIVFKGIGIHSGTTVDLALKPSDSGEIVFKRVDSGGFELRLDPGTTGAGNCSFLASRGCRIQTIEHLLAALSAFGIDSLLIELNGGEIPILDGSALPFAEAIAGIGTQPVGPGKRTLKILKTFLLEENGASLEVRPGQDFHVVYKIEFDHPAIGLQEAEFHMNTDAFQKEIAPARTFGFLKDVPELRRRGLALGGSFRNALVLDGEKVVNGPLRFPDEFVRHKILDLIGDLYLFGCPVEGRFRAHKAGHSLHLKSLRFLLDHSDYWEFRS